MHAEAATTDAPLLSGGVALRCVVHDCPNGFLFGTLLDRITDYTRFLADIDRYLPEDIREKLSVRIMEENLGLANLANLVRCIRCIFAVVLDTSPEEDNVFECLNCTFEYCRYVGAFPPVSHFSGSDSVNANGRTSISDTAVKSWTRRTGGNVSCT